MNALTLAELALQHATLNHRAEKLRQTWMTLPATPSAIRLGKEIKALQERADDYGRLLEQARETS
jgi:hypothetical protein